MTVQAHAKVNLALRILAKRADGYHDIETLMAPISLCDEIKLEVSEGSGIEILCDEPGIPVGPENLVWKSVDVFFQHTGIKHLVKINLHKNIPFGAGLGGGSSDAAAVLKALDEIFKTRLGEEALEVLAASLGSDVPFFIRSRPTVCRGRGEVMEEADALPAANLLLLKPPFPVSTAWAYQAWASGRQPPGERQAFDGIELFNDFEGPVFEKHLLLPAIKCWLLAQEEVSAALMSGSGSTTFALLRGPSGTLAQRAKERFGSTLWTHEAKLG